MLRVLAYYLFLLFLCCGLKSAAAQCNRTTTCRSCVDETTVDEGYCRWCRRDNKCYVAIPASCRCPTDNIPGACNIPESTFHRSDCDDELPRYDPELSRKMLLLSAVAYDSVHMQECLAKALPSSGFNDLKVCSSSECDSKGGECSGFVATSSSENAIVVAFRGSVDFTQVLQQLKEIRTVPKKVFVSGKGKVQWYWLRAFRKLWECMEPEVRAQRLRFPNYRIWVTGHSLGGAMASLASSSIAANALGSGKNIVLYTFGMPRVGNYYYAMQHDTLIETSWRVVNYKDPVPHFPSQLSLYDKYGPHHHGVELFYQKPAATVYSQHKECHGRPFMEDETCSAQFSLFQKENHVNYFGIRVGEYCFGSASRPETASASVKCFIIAHIISVVLSVFLFKLY